MFWNVGGLNYFHRKKITIDKTNVDGTLTDFPVKVNFSADGEIGAISNADGFDIRFTSSTGTVLPYERISFDISAGDAAGSFWVKVPSISASVDTIFFLYYRAVDTPDGENKTGVWDSYFSNVWHFEEDNEFIYYGSSTTEADTASIVGGEVTEDITTTGKVDNGFTLDYTRVVQLPFYSFQSDFTLSVWLKRLDTTTHHRFFTAAYFAMYAFAMTIQEGGVHDNELEYYDGASSYWLTGKIIDTNWHYLSFKIDSSYNYTAYLDGALVATGVGGVGVTPTGYPILGGDGYPFGGTLDEFRYSLGMCRSDEWVKFEFYNMNSAEGELTFGDEETDSFETSVDQMQDSKPITKVEFIDVEGNVTDISDWYIDGAQFEQVKDRAVSEIQAGNFDINLSNHDGYFSEFGSTSLFYNKQYHDAKIRISLGFVLQNGTVDYETQGVGFIDSLEASPSGDSKVTIRCRDLLKYILDVNINVTPGSEEPIAAGGNTGTGSCSAPAVKPFKTVNEDWTLTCTTLGGDNVGIFDVVGSVSGDVGNATSGTEFSTGTGTGGIKFTISAGGVAWAVGDIFTLSTVQHPEWSAVNLVKIIWSILTGYNYDGDSVEDWSGQVLGLDSTQTTANTDLDYTAFVDAISAVDALGVFDLTGYLLRDMSAIDAIQELLLLFQGSMFTNTDGKLSIVIYVSNFAAAPFASFLDSKKIKVLGYNRNIDEVINTCPIRYKSKLSWEFSNDQLNYQGTYTATDTDSVTKYGPLQYSTDPFYIRWFAASGAHVKDLADKIVSRFADPPLNIDFETGADGLKTTVGKVISVTDTKYAFSAVGCEVVKTTKLLDARPVTVAMRGRRDTNLGLIWGFIGSSIDEGDGLSPQNDDYDAASAADKAFAYFGSVATTVPDYRMF